MDLAWIVFRQLCVMALLIGIGISLTKYGLLTKEGGAQMSNILTSCVIPSVIISAFLSIEASMKSLQILVWSIVLFLCSLLFSMLVACLLFRDKQRINNAVSRICITFTNNGFFGIPLLQALFGTMGTFYASISVMCGNALTWSWGTMQFSQDNRFSAKKLLLQPAMLAVAAGIGLFVIRLTPLGSALATSAWFSPIGSLAVTVLDFLKTLNTPLAMLVLGVNISQTRWKLDRQLLGCFRYVGLRQFALPFVQLLVLRLLPIEPTLAFSVFVEACCPCAMITSIMAVRYHAPQSEQDKSARIVVTSTLSSLFSVPLMVMLGSLLLPMG